jgi:hypothetical protein
LVKPRPWFDAVLMSQRLSSSKSAIHRQLATPSADPNMPSSDTLGRMPPHANNAGVCLRRINGPFDKRARAAENWVVPASAPRNRFAKVEVPPVGLCLPRLSAQGKGISGGPDIWIGTADATVVASPCGRPPPGDLRQVQSRRQTAHFLGQRNPSGAGYGASLEGLRPQRSLKTSLPESDCRAWATRRLGTVGNAGR